MSSSWLTIEGAKQNNLKNISLRLPHNRVIAVTGISGSGKSSLAFDTIFAEGQWRFIESLSTYTRLFIEKLDRPDVDSIRNIRPAIALQQHNPVRGSRSTVGTMTEIYDLMRILFARTATPFCPECGSEVRDWNPSAVISELTEHHPGEKAVIAFESALGRSELRQKGFHRILTDGKVMEMDAAGEDAGKAAVVVDRLVIKASTRLTDSVETAWRHGRSALVVHLYGGKELRFSGGNTCDACGHEIMPPSPILFSFNHPLGACPVCRGFGNILKYSADLIIPDDGLSLSEGAIEPWEKPACLWWKEQLLEKAPLAGIDVHVPYRALHPSHKEMIFSGTEHFYGINDFFNDLEQKRYKIHVRVFLSRYRTAETCPACGGKRLRREALSYRVAGMDIAGIAEMKIGELIPFFEEMELTGHQKEAARDVLEQIRMKLGYLNRVGLHYLSLSRPSKTLSGGEYQRINLSNQLASHLTGTLYVLDEPTVGLHARDTRTIVEIMQEIAGLGNTVIVVEHDPIVIGRADWIVELGPGGGKDGGKVVFSGTADDFATHTSLTAGYLRGEMKTERSVPPRNCRDEHLVIRGATGHNLKNVTASIPLGTLTAVTGVSGSGKSSLIVETIYPAVARRLRRGAYFPLPHRKLEGAEGIRDIKLMDQSPIGKSPRSNPATYLKLFDPIRKCFAEQPEARARGAGAGFFSFNVPGGRCEECQGEGYQRIEMYFFEDVFVTCPSCNGTRYSPEALAITFRGRNISDVLDMTVDEAAAFFSDIKGLSEGLALLQEMGLGYLRLGQPATTLSGGEAQRMKICAELGHRTRGHTLYILDEPTVGLHPHDVKKLIKILHMLVDRGHTVIVIEHNLDLIRTADWIIDLGPEGGDGGGEIVFEGPPGRIGKSRRSVTGRYLRGLD